MSSSNGKVHFNVLAPSDADAIALGAAVEDKFVMLCDTYARMHHGRLVPPRSLDNDMLRWRKMRMRHRSGDFRNTEAELYSTKAIATWTLAVNSELRGQPPSKVQWKE